MTTHEITKTSAGLRVVQWHWRNGWNLVDLRQPTDEEIAIYNRESKGLPVVIMTED